MLRFKVPANERLHSVHDGSVWGHRDGPERPGLCFGRQLRPARWAAANFGIGGRSRGGRSQRREGGGANGEEGKKELKSFLRRAGPLAKAGEPFNESLSIVGHHCVGVRSVLFLGGCKDDRASLSGRGRGLLTLVLAAVVVCARVCGQRGGRRPRLLLHDGD